MNAPWSTAARCGLTLALSLSLGAGLGARCAQAATVEGYDSYVQQEQDGSIGLLSVEMGADEQLWCRISEGDTVLADRLEVKPDDLSSSADGSLTLVSIDASSLVAGHSYSISVYADRDETQLLYAGTLSSVEASLQGVDNPILIAWRTLGSEQRSFAAPQTISYQGTVFELTSNEPSSTDPLAYDYQPADAGATDVSATVSYVDQNGAELRTDEVGQLDEQGDALSYQVPELINANGSWYRTIFFNRSLSFSFSGRRSARIACQQVSSQLAAQEGFHSARIRMVDQDGNALATDRVSVAGSVAYTAPETIYMDKDGDGVAETYQLQGSAQLDLEPTTDDVVDGVKDYELVYTRQTEGASWQIVYLDATNGSFGQVLATRDIEVSAANTQDNPATFQPESIEVDGSDYESLNSDQLSWVWGQNGPVSYVYCAPRGAALDTSDHVVTVNYVDLATGQRIGGITRTLTADMLSDITIQTPATLTVGSASYVRLDGQESGVRTGYYAGANPSYTVYYRDVNDDLNRSTVITTIIVRYLDGGSTVQNGATTTTAGQTEATAAGQGTATGTSTATTGIRSGDDLTAVGDGDNGTIANGQGQDLDTERIDDDETPLASGTEELAGLSQGFTTGSAALIGFIGAGALLLLLVSLRRRKDDDAPAANER